MSDKLQFRTVRVVGIVDDKLPQMLVAVEVEVDEFYCQAPPLGPDDRSLYIDAYRVFGPDEVDRYPAEGLRGRNGIAGGQADAPMLILLPPWDRMTQSCTLPPRRC